MKSTTDGDLPIENSTKNLSNDEDDFEILENFQENLFLHRENGNANDTDIITNLKDVEKLFDPIDEVTNISYYHYFLNCDKNNSDL